MAQGLFVEILPLVLPALVVVALCKLVYNKYHSSQLLLPGPTLAAWTKHWRAYAAYGGRLHLTTIELHRKHGKLVRLAPDVVSVADADELSNIYGMNSSFHKTALYPIQSITWEKKVELNLFSTRSPAEHRKLRRQVGSSFSLSSLLQAEPAIDSCTELLLKKLQDTAGVPVDLGEWLQYFAFDVVGEVTFAKKFGFLEEGRDIDGMMAGIASMTTYSGIIGQVPEWHGRLLGNPILTWLTPPLEEWNHIIAFTLRALRARTQFKGQELVVDEEAKGTDLLSRWKSVKQDDAHKMDLRALMVHLTATVFAGSDTTAIAMRSVFYQLCRNADKMEKLVDEIVGADKAGLLGKQVGYKEITAHLPYSMAVVKEGMRMHPSVGHILERHCPPEGATICGHYLPGGTIVGINAWVLNYDPANFVEPESFIPERWLQGTEAELKRREQILSFNFGSGERSCIGKHLAVVETHKVVVELFRRFDVRLSDPTKEWQTKIRWFVEQTGLSCILTPR